MVKAVEGITVGRRYEVQRHLATGGMATVFRGWDHRYERPVAIKMLRALDEANPADLLRFRREARVLSALHCPQIVEVCDFTEEDGCLYLIMELVEGVTLKEHLARHGPLPAVEALLLAAEICRALECAHVEGFIHRDIKPQNVLLAESGEVKLTDFGIVHIAGSASLTASGMVLGTADYLSPEQAQGLALTPASDLYSLGIVLFEMLTHSLPFAGTSVAAVALKHAQDPVPSLRARNPGVPMRVERLVRRALAKKPQQRFRSAREMEAALRGAAALLQSREAIMASAEASSVADGETTRLHAEQAPCDVQGQQATAWVRRTVSWSGEGDTVEEDSLNWAAALLSIEQPLEAMDLPPLPEAMSLARTVLTLAVALLLLVAVVILPHLL
jgi:serine/threonine-protein kinase